MRTDTQTILGHDVLFRKIHVARARNGRNAQRVDLDGVVGATRAVTSDTTISG